MLSLKSKSVRIKHSNVKGFCHAELEFTQSLPKGSASGWEQEDGLEDCLGTFDNTSTNSVQDDKKI